jgi:hypothetical protein
VNAYPSSDRTAPREAPQGDLSPREAGSSESVDPLVRALPTLPSWTRWVTVAVAPTVASGAETCADHRSSSFEAVRRPPAVPLQEDRDKPGCDGPDRVVQRMSIRASRPPEIMAVSARRFCSHNPHNSE